MGKRRDLRIGIIGAGFSGLCAAIRLRRSGFDDFVIFERAADIVIFATGFAATDFLAPMKIYGRGEEELSASWKQGAARRCGRSSCTLRSRRSPTAKCRGA